MLKNRLHIVMSSCRTEGFRLLIHKPLENVLELYYLHEKTE